MDAATGTGPEVSCRRCGHRIAGATAAIAVTGAHRHDVVNPGGFRYRLGCFEAAAGCIAAGETSHEASFFPGYTWQRAFCRRCSRHVGWLFRHKTGVFYGLIE